MNIYYHNIIFLVKTFKPVYILLLLGCFIACGNDSHDNTDEYIRIKSTFDFKNEQYFPLLPTGQTECFNNIAKIPCSSLGGIPAICTSKKTEPFCGQDAQYIKNLYNRFEIKDLSSDPVVIDNVTGIIWQKNPTRRA